MKNQLLELKEQVKILTDQKKQETQKKKKRIDEINDKINFLRRSIRSSSRLTKNKLRKIFLEMDKNPKGKELLRKLNIDKFSLIQDEQYDSIRKMVEIKNKKQ